MIGPQVQKAIVAALRPLAGGRVYDRFPPNAPFPYIVVGDEQSVDDSDQCGDLIEVFSDVHVWSRDRGRVEAKEIGEAVRQTLATELTVEDYDLVEQEFRDGRVLIDPDGITAHAVLTFRLLLQPE